MIQVRKTTVEKDGGCSACHERLMTVKQISVGDEHQTMTFRLCSKCERELKAALNQAG